MARIDWALLCELAFMDRQDRLCLIGIVHALPVPHLPLALHQVTLVARLTDIQRVDEVGIAISIVTPGGGRTTPGGADDVLIEMAGEYVLATLRDVPLAEEGIYRFQIALTGQPIVSVNVPVLSAGGTASAGLQ